MKHLILSLLLLPLLGCAAEAPRDLAAQRDLVLEATQSVNRLISDPDNTELRKYMQNAKAVLIIPNMYRAGFVLGGEYGSGILMVKTGQAMGGVVQAAPVQGVEVQDLQSGETSGSAKQTWTVGAPATPVFGGSGWGNPIFYRLAGGSAGLQIGAQSAEIIITIMTDRGLNGFLNNSFKLGADASLAVGPLGKNVAAGTTVAPPAADMYTFGSTMGLYGGVSLSGAVLRENANWNMLVYGAKASPRDVMQRSDSPLSEAAALRDALSRGN